MVDRRQEARLSEDELDRLFREYRKGRSADIRDRVVRQFAGLVESVARSVPNSSEPVEDLVQEGYVGLVKAVDMYDVDRGVKFITYATHLILGEIKHYLRDRKSIIREPGWLHELNQKVSRSIERLTQEQGQYPPVSDIAKEVGVEESAVLEVLRTRGVFRVGSLDITEEGGREPGSAPVLDTRRMRSLEYSSLELPLEDRIVLDQALGKLKGVERDVIENVFYKDLSQTEVARRLGVSCNYVSHVVRTSLRKLRALLEREEQKEASLRLRAAIERRREHLEALEEQGVLDELTGLRRRGYFAERLRDECLRAFRYSHELAVMLVDIDALDRYNSSQTRAAGDEAIRRVANILRTNVRRVDVVTCVGGGAFGLILPHTGGAVRTLGERLVQKILDARIGAPQTRQKHLTARAGTAVYPVDGFDEQELLESATAALLAAKQRGGNCVVGAEPLVFPATDETDDERARRIAFAVSRTAEMSG